MREVRDTRGMAGADSRLAEADRAYTEQRWGDCCDAYAAAHEADETLSGDDFLQWAMANFWGSDPERAIETMERAVDRFAAEGDGQREAYAALLVFQLGIFVGNDTVTGPALTRAMGLLEEVPECEGHALSAYGTAAVTAGHDANAAEPMMRDALEVARRVGSPSVEALCLVWLAQHLCTSGEVTEGRRYAEAAGALALSGRVKELAAGGVLCGVIFAYIYIGAWKQAAEWGDTTMRWVDRTGVSMWPGLCRFHLCEIDRVRGHLDAAERGVMDACEELSRLNRPAAGFAYRELGVVRLRRGDLAGAEEAFRSALEFGLDPNPGLAELRMRQGDVAAAKRGLEERLASGDAWARGDRGTLLPALATACIGDGDVDRAREAAVELAEYADACETEPLLAAALQAQGEIAVAEGDIETARTTLRRAWETWSSAGAPYEAAVTLRLLGDAALAQGNTADARLEFEAARSTFERVGARADVADLDRRLRGLEAPREPARAVRTFMFTDIVDSTKLSETLGDQRWMKVLAWHDRTIRDAVGEHGGEEVKHEGDGLFVVFPDPDAAVRCACRIVERFDAHREEAGFAPDLRIGLHTGEAGQQDADWFGGVVNLTARVCGAANAGEVLCTDEVLAAAGADIQVEATRQLDLKGIGNPVRGHVVAVD